MAVNIKPPSDVTDTSGLADWLELVSLVADDNNSSRGDLEQVVRRSGVYDAYGPLADEKIDAFCLEVFYILENRRNVLAVSYPFEIKGGLIKARKTPKPDQIPYIYCLCLSYFGGKKRKGLDPRLLFEELASYAAAAYVDGECFIFGTSRTRNGRATLGFKKGVSELCKFLGEGSDFRDQPGLGKKDDKVDLVAVKHFSDRASSKLIVFGQCATGNNWTTKTTEMQPAAFCGHWMQSNMVSEMLRSIFIPHLVKSSEWDYYARRAGLVFDRTRISYWASRHKKFGPNASKFSKWFQLCLGQP